MNARLTRNELDRALTAFGKVGRDVGGVYLANTCGAIAGSACMASENLR